MCRTAANATDIRATAARVGAFALPAGSRDAAIAIVAGTDLADMARAVNERLDSVTHRVGQSMEATTRHTMDSLRVLHERLGIIDNAHRNLTDLTTQVTTLRDVLANKQSRGAFGQARMGQVVHAPGELAQAQARAVLIHIELRRKDSAADIEKICYKNVFRVWNKVIDVSGQL